MKEDRDALFFRRQNYFDERGILMDLRQKKKLKKVLIGVSIVLYLIVIVKWNIIRITYGEAPYYYGLLVVAFICSVAAAKIKAAAPGTGKDGLGLKGRWKCSCGVYNDDNEKYCSRCGAERPQPPQNGTGGNSSWE